MGQVVNQVTLEKGLRAEFMKSYDQVVNSKIIQAVMQVSSSAQTEKYGWLGSTPELQAWADEKAPKGLLDKSYSLTNSPFEATIGVDKFSLRDDQLGAVKIRVADLAMRAKQFPVKLAVDLLSAGTSGLCYDGQAFFSASHSEGASGTQSNIVTGTGVTLAQITADYISAKQKIMSVLDDQGKPFNEGEPQILVVAPAGLAGIFEQLQNATLISNTSNVFAGQFQLGISARLTGNDWYMLDVSGAVKPLIIQENMPVTFGALEDKSDSGFLRKHYYYGVEWYGASGYGLWQKAVKVDN